MTYVTKTPDQYTRNRLDMEAFAKDLAKALGNGARYAGIRAGWGEIQVGDNMLDIGFSEWKGMASISINTTDLKPGEWSTYAAEQRVHGITLHPDRRPIESIARDVRKRCIDANLPALEARRQYAAGRRAARNQLALTLGRLKEICPSLSLTKRDPDAESATFYHSDPYVQGTVDSDGKIRIERIEGMTLAQFAAVLEVMGGTVEQKPE